MATKYHGQALAEQNSVDLAWAMLMDSQYKELRSTICTSDEEMQLFRQLLVNIVVATKTTEISHNTLFFRDSVVVESPTLPLGE